MQIDKGSCSPEQFRTLQSIFDNVWMVIRAGSSQSLADPRGMEALHFVIARRVLDYAQTRTSADDIIRGVLNSFGIKQTA
jgi:hypothetical protein